MERLTNAAGRLTTPSSAWLQVVLPQCFVVSVIPEALRILHRSNPGIGVTLEYLPSKEAVELVASGEWNFGIAHMPISNRAVEARTIMQSAYVCVLPEGTRFATASGSRRAILPASRWCCNRAVTRRGSRSKKRSARQACG
nr:LysR substrate-binding domain-containing protein [Marinicella sp. W31]MDC2875473.1 LysR substrate-binding domain-containing protein [Marinicella sp. W31]